MRIFFPLLLILVTLGGCKNELSEPWAQVNYTEAGCGTKDAVLTTAGCNVNPAVIPPKPTVVAVTPGVVTVTTEEGTTNPALIEDNAMTVDDVDDVNNHSNSQIGEGQHGK